MEGQRHEAVNCISWLVGTWIGQGSGEYPTIKPFNFNEEIVFEHFGQPMLNYRSITKHPESNNLMHQEVGYLKVKPGTCHVAFCLSQNTGVTEIDEGCVDEGKQLHLKSAFVNGVSFGKEPHVLKVERTYKLLDHNHLEMTLSMETTTQKMGRHLHNVYTRQENM